MNIWVQPLPDGQPVQITHGNEDATEPDFSPDGSRIVFRSERNGGGIFVLPALGGGERFVAPKGRRPGSRRMGSRSPTSQAARRVNRDLDRR
jgi:Tol biopolymer transport system component